MATEILTVGYYGANGLPDATLTPTYSIYDLSDNSVDFSGTLVYDATLTKYKTTISADSNKEYICNIDFGVSALTRYASIDIPKVTASGGGGGGLTTEEHDKLLSLSTGGGASINLSGITGNLSNINKSINTLKTDLETKMMDDMEVAYAEMEKANESEKKDIYDSADEIIAELEKEKTKEGKNTIETIKKLIQ